MRNRKEITALWNYRVRQDFSVLPPCSFLSSLQLVQFLRKTPGNAQDKKELLDKIDALRQESTAQRSEARESALQLQAEVRKDVQSSVNEAMSTFSRVFSENMKYSADAQALRIGEIGEMQNLRLAENNQKLESMRENGGAQAGGASG